MELPLAFKEKYQTLLDDAEALFEAIEEGAPQKGFRLNPLKPAAAEMLSVYGPKRSPAPYAQNGYLGEVSGRSLLHQAGYVYSQEPSAMIVATVADARPGEKVLDLCAAPGGKTTQLAGQMQNEGLLVANEIFPKRAKILAENVERWGAANAIVTNHAPHELVKHFSGFFDRIVVDAPCSGEGMFRKDEQAIAEWTEQTPLQCAARQKEILDSALQMLKTEGTLIYSTCTFAPEENEQIISWLVENYPITIEPIEIENVSHGRPEWGSVAGLEQTVRLWPHKNQGEGHFVAKLRFHGENSEKKSKKTKNSIDRETQRLWQALSQAIPAPTEGTLAQFGDQLWLVPESAPSLKGIKFLRAGLHLGTVKKNRIEPSFALAMAVNKTADYPCVHLSIDEWKKYVAGETISKAGNAGWVLLCVEQIPVGFGKQVQGTIKNFFPKGLRFQAV